jgi:hypothetical protein
VGEPLAAIKHEIAFGCPRCGYRVESAVPLGVDARGQTRPPGVGEVALCLLCGAPVEVQAEGRPRWLTFEEVAGLLREGDVGRRIVSGVFLILTRRPSRVRVEIGQDD